MNDERINQTVREIGEAIRRLESGEIDPRPLVFNRTNGNYSMRIIEEREEGLEHGRTVAVA